MMTIDSAIASTPRRGRVRLSSPLIVYAAALALSAGVWTLIWVLLSH